MTLSSWKLLCDRLNKAQCEFCPFLFPSTSTPVSCMPVSSSQSLRSRLAHDCIAVGGRSRNMSALGRHIFYFGYYYFSGFVYCVRLQCISRRLFTGISSLPICY